VVPLVKVKIPKAIAKGKRKSKNVIKGGGGTSTVVSVTEGFADFDSATPPSEASLLEPPEEVELPSSPKEDVPDAAVGIDEIPDIVSGDEEVAVVSPEPAELEDEPPPLVEEEPVQVATESPEDVFAEPPSPEEPELEVVPVLKEDEAPVEAAVVETKTCPECGRDMVVKDDRFGKFWSCTGMPACHHSETYEKKKSVKERLSCPLCKCGTLTVNRTPAGKDMYICDDAACEFMAWAKPHAISCPLCNSPFLVQKKDRQGNISLRCPMAGCSYIHGGTADESVVKPKKKKIRVRRKKGSGGVKKRRVVRRRKK
jgi:ssDNA-binding Zn-finger/Zn-ribbon topoisomerase 1